MQDCQAVLLHEDSTSATASSGVQRSVHSPHLLVSPEGMQKAFQVCRQVLQTLPLYGSNACFNCASIEPIVKAIIACNWQIVCCFLGVAWGCVVEGSAEFTILAVRCSLSIKSQEWI